MLGGVNSMEDHFKLKTLAKHVHLHLKHPLKLAWRIDMQRSRTPQHAESGNHTDKSQTMIAMQVTDKHRLNTGETHPGTAQLHLRTFATVDHEKLPTYVDHLRRGVVFERGQGTATT